MTLRSQPPRVSPEHRQHGEREKGQEKRALSVWLAEEDIEALKLIAQRKGIGHTTLVRMWVKERLQKEAKQET